MTDTTIVQTDHDPGSPPVAHRRAGTVAHSDMRWVTCTDMADQLFGRDAPHWLHLADDPRATCVKTGHQRRIWRVDLPDGAVFAKRFTGRGRLDQIKTVCGLANGQREWRCAVAATAKGIHVAGPLAVGVKRSAPVAVVYLCRAYEGGVPLLEAWTASSNQPRQVRRQLIESVATLFASTHRSGFRHLDGHPNNVLVRHQSAESFDAILIDLAWARIRKRPLGTASSATSLAQLDHYFRRVATKTERLRFLHAYHDDRLTHDPERAITDRIRCLLETIESAHRRHTRRLAARRDRRLRRNGTYFAAIPLGDGWSGIFSLKQARRHRFDLSRVKDRTVTDWRKIMAPLIARPYGAPHPADPAPGLTARMAHADRLAQRIAWTVFGSPARQAFFATHRRRHRDDPAPLMLGFAQHYRGGLVDLAVTIQPEPQDDTPSDATTGGDS